MKKIYLFWIIPFVILVGCGQQNEDTQQVPAKTVGTEIETDSKTNSDEESQHNYDIQDETIVIPGLSKNYSYLYLTDAHTVVLNEEDSEQVNEYATQRLEEFTFQNQYTSKEQFDNWMEYMKKLNLDGLLLGGDIIDSPSKGNLEYLQIELSQISIPYLYNLGNHDWTYPWEYMTDLSKTTYLPLLSPMLQDSPAIQTLENDEFIIVAVDNSSNQINDEALQEYKEILNMKKPVILMLHVPLLTQSVLTKAKETWPSGVVLGGGNYGGIYPDEVSTEFIELTTQDNSPVVAVLAGHVHFYDKDMINDHIVQIVGGAAYEGKGILLTLTGE